MRYLKLTLNKSSKHWRLCRTVTPISLLLTMTSLLLTAPSYARTVTTITEEHTTPQLSRADHIQIVKVFLKRGYKYRILITTTSGLYVNVYVVDKHYTILDLDGPTAAELQYGPIKQRILTITADTTEEYFIVVEGFGQTGTARVSVTKEMDVV